MSDKTQAGWYPSGLRLGERQEEVLRQWPLERIRPKSVSLGVRSLFAEVDALREQLAAKTARLTALERACYQEVPEGGPHTFSGFGCLLCGWDCSPEFPEMHEPSCLLYAQAGGEVAE